MADPFAAGLSALHGTGASVAAEYTPPGGSAIALRVVHEQPSVVGGDIPEVVMDTHRLVIQRSDVALPEVGGTIVVDPDGAAETYTLAGDPLLDTEGVSWSCPAEPAG